MQSYARAAGRRPSPSSASPLLAFRAIGLQSASLSAWQSDLAEHSVDRLEPHRSPHVGLRVDVQGGYLPGVVDRDGRPEVVARTLQEALPQR